MNKRLTHAAIQKYAAGNKRRRIRDAGAQSLYLIVEPSGVKSFEMRFRRPDGRPAKMRLGRYSNHAEIADEPVVGMPLTLAAARQLATKVHRERQLGVDVIATHKAAKVRKHMVVQPHDADSFATAVHDYMRHHALVKTRNWYETARMLGTNYTSDGTYTVRPGGLLQRWGDRKLTEIDRADIKAVIGEARHEGVPGVNRRNKHASEARARALFTALSSFFGWAEEEERIEVNPCNGLKRPKPAEVRDRVLDKDEVIAFWKACDKLNPPFGIIYKLLLLTGARLNEVAGMRWSELHDDGWHLPSSRTKNKKPHVVPLAPAAQALIAKVKNTHNPGDLLFTSTGITPVSGWTRAKRNLDKAMLTVRGKNTPPWRIHDLRRTAVTGMADLGIRPDVVELVVNHVSGHRGGIAGVYNRSELLPERKAALERWAAHVQGLLSGTSDNVVSLKRRKGR